MRGNWLLGAVIVCLATCTVAVGAPREWYDYYEEAEEAMREQRWAAAESLLMDALRARPDPGVALPTYGMRYVNYFPYLKLGIAYYNLGNYDAALQTLEREEKAGAVSKSGTDRQNLETFKRLAREAKTKVGDAEQERLRQAVELNLTQARTLEREGRIDEALAAASRASALEPSNSEVAALLARLREKAAELLGANEVETRRSRLVEDGRAKLAADKLEDAAQLFTQALSLKADAAVQALLNDARARLRAQSEARTADERTQLLQAAIGDARKLEREQRYTDALGRLQTALAVDPRNTEALSLQERLSRAESDRRKSEDIARAMNEGVGYMQHGMPEKAAESFNWILAIDPGNSAASANFLQALQQIKGAIAGGPAHAPKIVPIIVLAKGGSTETVREPEVELAGTVLDDGPELRLTITTPAGTKEESIKGDRTGNLYRFDFAEPVRMGPGRGEMRVIAVDVDELKAEATRFVIYARPWHRSPWALGALAGTIVLAGCSAFAWRVRIRARALKRRFNPYTAGTPVLEEDSFFGREPLLQRIMQSIHNNSILLYGERRIGKTSIQHQLRKRLLKTQDPEYEFVPVYVDLQGVPQEKFFATLAADIFHDLGDRIDFSYASADPRDDGTYGYEAFVRDLRAILKSVKAVSDKRFRLVLLIDEVDQLNDYDPRVNQKLRSLFMKSFAEDMRAVVSGVAIKKQWESEGSPWYNFFEEIEVKPFTRQDAVDLIERPIRGIFEIEPGVSDRIIDLTGCRPYLIQKICMSVVSRLHEERRRRITLRDLESVSLPVEG